MDPSTLGQDGTGGTPNAEALALLENKNIVLDDVGVADIKAGKIDPRIVGVLTKLSQDHKIVVSCMCSDHSKFTAGGSISNHAFGRGLDIASIDGEIVSPGSALAREMSSELSELDPRSGPTRSAPRSPSTAPATSPTPRTRTTSTSASRQEITPDFKLPAELAAGGAAPPAPRRGGGAGRASRAAPVAAPAAAVPAAAVAAPPDPKQHSGLFAAVAAARQRRRRRGQGGRRAPDSNLFLQAVAPPSSSRARVAAAPAAEAPAAGAPPSTSRTRRPTYPGDDAPKEQIAAWMAAEAEKRGIPPQLPVMAALVESGLENVNFGDADSLGYFQMRTSIWESDYPGSPTDPDKQIDWFLDQAEAVKAQRDRRGQPIDDPAQFGEWIADVERPAEQFRGRYQLRLDEANGLLKAAPDDTRRACSARGRPRDARRAGRAGRAGGGAGRALRAGGSVQLGQDGTGGKPNAEALALLENKNIVLDDVGVADIKARQDRPADRRRAHQAQPGAQDRRLVHVQRPLASSPPAARSPTTRSAAASTSPRSTARSSARAARWHARSPPSSPTSTPRSAPTRSARPSPSTRPATSPTPRT